MGLSNTNEQAFEALIEKALGLNSTKKCIFAKTKKGCK